MAHLQWSEGGELYQATLAERVCRRVYGYQLAFKMGFTMGFTVGLGIGLAILGILVFAFRHCIFG